MRHRRRVGGEADPRSQSRGRVAVERYERDQVGPAVAGNDRVGDQRRLPRFLFDLQSDSAAPGHVSRDDPSRDSASSRASRYRAAEADRRAWDNARRPQRCKLALHPALCKLVACKLSEDWSPEQIAGWQKLGSPEDHTCRVSHETIYQTPVHPDARCTEARAVVASAKGRFRPPAPRRERPACRPEADP